MGSALCALELCILTAARTGEIIGARWDEIDGDVWTVPAERMKMRRAHRVPLSDRALGVLDALPRLEDYIFPGTIAGKPISNMADARIAQGHERRQAHRARLPLDVFSIGRARAPTTPATLWKWRSPMPSRTSQKPPIAEVTRYRSVVA